MVDTLVCVPTLGSWAEDFMNTHGKASPFLGSDTSEKTTTSKYVRTAEVDTLLARPIRIVRSVGWFIPSDSLMADFLKNMLSSMTDADPDLFTSMQGNISGSAHHRYIGLFSRGGGFPNTNLTPFSHLVVTTNRFVRSIKSGINYNIHFQPALCALQAMTCKAMIDSSVVTAGHFHINCPTCIQALPSETIVGDQTFRDY